MSAAPVRSIARSPFAWLPIAMSLAALALVLAYASVFGTARQSDEGTAAHLWQLLMAGQVPIAAFFAIRWLPEAPQRALGVLALQFLAAVSACAPVFLLGW